MKLPKILIALIVVSLQLASVSFIPIKHDLRAGSRVLGVDEFKQNDQYKKAKSLEKLKIAFNDFVLGKNYTQSEFQYEIPIYAFSAKLGDEASFDDITFSVTFGDGSESDKYILEKEEAGKEDSGKISSLYTFSKGIKEIIVNHSSATSIDVTPYSFSGGKISMADINPSDLEFQEYQKKIFENAGINLITRPEWGVGYYSAWAPKIVDVDKIIIHHTATGVYEQDPSETVRAIYNYHANTLGWGDIGYNYLIDPYGNIYEGRTGGNGVVGGHTIATKEPFVGTSANTGSIGISIIGNYEYSRPTTASLTALSKLLSFVGSLNDIDISWEESMWGHRDYTATACPGYYLYNVLDDVAYQTNALNFIPSDAVKTKEVSKELVDGRDYKKQDGKVETITLLGGTNEENQILLANSDGFVIENSGKKYLVEQIEEGLLKQKLAERLNFSDNITTQPNFVYEFTSWDNSDPNRSVPGDYDPTTHWNLEKTKTPEAWKEMGGCVSDNSCGGDPNVVIAVIDSGVAYEDYNYDAGATYTDTYLPSLGFSMEVASGSPDGEYNEGYDRVYNVAPELSGVNFVSPYDAGWHSLCYYRQFDSVENRCNTTEWGKIDHANDDYGHGTFVANIIAADTGQDDTGDELVGIAHNVSIMPVKVSLPYDNSMCHDANGYNDPACSDANNDHRGLITSLTLSMGIDHAVENGADIINTSLAGEGLDPAEEDSIQNALDNGVIFIAASGNNGDLGDNIYPAAYPGVISVGASSSDDTRASYSNYGDTLDLVAPVGTSTDPNWLASMSYQCFLNNPSPTLGCSAEGTSDKFTQFTSASSPITGLGTSYAAPQVAAAAGLYLSTNPYHTIEYIRSALAASARDISQDGRDSGTGFGVLDIYRLLTQPSWVDEDNIRSSNLVGDFNGDGKDDIALAREVDSTTTQWYVALSTGSQFINQGIWKSDFGNQGDQYFVGDFNGDGKDDIAVVREADSVTVRWYVALSAGDHFSGAGVWIKDFGNAGDSYHIGDFNGDGRYDISVSRPINSETVRWYVGISTGVGFKYSGIWKGDFGNVVGDVFRVGDFNGDSKTDISVGRKDGKRIVGWYVGISTGGEFLNNGIWKEDFGNLDDYFRIGDANGDNLADLIVIREMNPTVAKWYVGKSSGSYFSGSSIYIMDFGDVEDRYRIGDFNGDGKEDAAVARTIGEMRIRWYVALSNGNNLENTGVWKEDFGNAGDFF